MKKIIEKMVLVAALTAVCACSSGLKDKLGLSRNVPDEFRVISNSPLVVPPDFTLRPPAPGAKWPSNADAAQEARNILLEKKVKKSRGSRSSKGESAFLNKAGAKSSDSNIKELLIQDELNAKKTKSKRSLLERVNFFKKRSSKQDSVEQKDDSLVDDIKEENMNEGKSKDVKGGFLSRVFGL